MPHVTLEFSNNIKEKDNLLPVLQKAQQILEETLPAQKGSTKARAVGFDHCWVDDGDQSNSFIHMGVKVKSGRSLETLNRAGELLLKHLRESFQQAAESSKLSLTVEITELAPCYHKWESGEN